MEIPAGMVDPGEQDPIEAARRELMEETGYAAETSVKIGTVEPNPAFLNNRCHTYLALGVTKVHEPQMEGSEDIVVEELPLSTLDTLVTSGRVTHSLTVCAFYHFNSYRARHSLAPYLNNHNE
jgi:8-oxo-dGTP pyrophosphatase MutT (NUDIX family)